MLFNLTDYRVEDTSSVKCRVSEKGLKALIEAGYGLSMHWGLYSINGRGEWVMHNELIPVETYRRRMAEFNPIRFNAEEWADLMLESGQKLLVITTKHHDGFCLFDSKLTDFKITNTPLKRDIIAELAPALRDRGLSLHLYYSLLDWSHPAYRNDWPAYVAYYQGQLRELLTNYGAIGGMVFDGYWPRQGFDGADAYFAAGGPWDLAGTYDMIHSLQPDAVIANNTHSELVKGEDYQLFELDLPGENTIGFNTTWVSPDKPKVVWWNLNGGWAYAPRMHNVKTPAAILNALARAKARGAMFYLNIGPRPFGDIHPEEAAALREIGRLKKQFGL